MLPYARPSITDAEVAEVEECLRSGWLSTGPRARRFEDLHLALLAAGVGPGDEVITTPMTWVSTGNVILHAGARPVFVDVEPDTLNLDASRVEAALTPRTRALLPVHFAGQPCDEDALLDICRRHGLALVEDAAHALGASYKGRTIGTIGDLTMFSFHPAKNLTTGEGGAVVTDDDERAARMRRLRFHGIDQSPDARSSGRGPGSYELLEAGFKYNFTDLQAAIGLQQLARLDALNARRAQLAKLYRARLADVRHVEPLGTAAYEHVHAWHILVVKVDPDALSIGRDGVIDALREAGVGAGLHFVPLHLLKLYRDDVDPASLPAATEADRRILTLPLFPDMTDADVDFVVETLGRVLREAAR